MKRKPVVIHRGWGLKGPLSQQVAVAKEASRQGLSARHGDAVREIERQMKRRTKK